MKDIILGESARESIVSGVVGKLDVVNWDSKPRILVFEDSAVSLFDLSEYRGAQSASFEYRGLVIGVEASFRQGFMLFSSIPNESLSCLLVDELGDPFPGQMDVPEHSITPALAFR